LKRASERPGLGPKKPGLGARAAHGIRPPAASAHPCALDSGLVGQELRQHRELLTSARLSKSVSHDSIQPSDQPPYRAPSPEPRAPALRSPEPRVPAFRPPASLRGFTLIELLVAMALVALLMTMVYEGLRTGQRASETGQAFIDRTNRLRITHEFLRHQFARIMPLPYKQDASNGKLFMFEGDGDKIRFVAPMPGYLGFGGTYVQEFEIIRDGRDRSLVFRHWLHNGFDEKDIDKSEKPLLLLGGIRDGGFKFRGLNAEGKVGEWTGRWEDSQVTPLMIRLELTMSPESRIDWPLLEVAMMVDGGATRGFNAGFFPSG